MLFGADYIDRGRAYLGTMYWQVIIFQLGIRHYVLVYSEEIFI